MSETKKQQLQRASVIISAVGALCMPLVLWGLNCTHTKVAAYDGRLQQIELEIAVIKETRFKREDGERINARSTAADVEHERRLNTLEQALREIPANLIDRFARVEERMAVIGEDVQEIKERLP